MPEIIARFTPYDSHTVEEKRYELVKKRLTKDLHTQALENTRNKQFYDAVMSIRAGAIIRICGAGILPWREIVMKKVVRGGASACFSLVFDKNGNEESVAITADMILYICQ